MFAVRTTARQYAMKSLTIVAMAASLGASVSDLNAQATQKATMTPVSNVVSREPNKNWYVGLKAKHRQLFDAPAPVGGVPLVHVMNYYDTWNKAYGVKDSDINAVLTFYGTTTFYGLNDAMWAKYKLGEYLETNDASGKPAVTNPWKSAPFILGMTIPTASIESLQKRGATMILCNNALGIFSALLAQKQGLDPKVVYEDMKANILPGVELVPGMVVAIEQAARAGLSYHRQ